MSDVTAPFVTQLLNRMRMRQVALMLAIGEGGTLRHAADTLGMTQPAATKMIQELESALGQRLFERHGRGQRLTLAGVRVLGYFRGMRGSIESMARELDELRLGSSGRVSIGSIMAPSPTLLNRAILTLKKTYPLLTVDVTLDTSDKLLDLLREGLLDIAIGRIDEKSQAEYVFTSLEDETLAVVVGASHPLSKKRRVPFAALLDFPWILQPIGSPMRTVLEQEFRALQVPTPRGMVETASILSTTQLIAESQMVGVLPWSIANTYAKHGLLKILPCAIQHKMGAFGSITRRDRPLSEASRFFIQALHKGHR